jgi:predicted PurR-regulated permease PerM
VSVGEIAALVAAGAFVILVGFLAVPIVKLGRTLDEATLAIRKAHEGTQPLLTNAATTMDRVNSELERVEGITRNAQSITSNVAGLVSLFAATMGGPVVRLAAFSYGVRRAFAARRRAEEEKAAKAERRAARRARRRGGT